MCYGAGTVLLQVLLHGYYPRGLHIDVAGSPLSPDPGLGSVCAAWWECDGLGEGSGRLGWWGHTYHPPAKLPEEIPPGERIQTVCVIFPYHWASGLGTHTLFSSQLFCGWVITFQILYI